MSEINMVMRSFNRGDIEYLEAIDNKAYDYGHECDWFIENSKSCRVADVPDSEGPVGFYVMEAHSRKSLSIVRFAVAPPFRRMGIGTAMMDDIMTEGYRYNRLIVAVPESNLGAQLFLQANYFTCIRLLKHDKKKETDPDPEPDYLFCKDIGKHE
jgi:ribosomal protein S18 acetylase RimI-like enzyme